MKKNSIYVWLGAILLGSLAGLLYFGHSRLNEPIGPTVRQIGEVAREEINSDRSGEKEKWVQLTSEQMRQFGVILDTAKPGKLQQWLSFPGEVVINTDRVAHIVPRVTGVVSEVRKSLGDMVRRGEVMAVLESRELADSKAAFLAAQQRILLAETTFRREEQLWQKRISAEQEYIQSKNSLADARIELQTAEQKLRALGLSAEQIRNLPHDPQRELTRYEMTAPFDATIVEKHIDLGEVLKDDTPGFKIADLTSVWVQLDVHQRDTPFVRVGQKVTISAGPGLAETDSRISYIEPIVNEQTRTLHARVTLENHSGKWQPGLFITGRIVREDLSAAVLVPNEAIILVEGTPHVFVQMEVGFQARPVKLGTANESYTEILGGLDSGQPYVVKGAFILKSEWDKPQSEE